MIRAVYHPDHLGGRDFTVDYFGGRYTGNTAEFIDWSVYVYGVAERAVVRHIRRLMANASGPWTLIDAGANSGTFTLAFADLIETGLAFEPVSATRARLTRNLALNEITHVAVQGCALGARDGEAEIHFPSRHANRGIASLSAARNRLND